MNWCLIAECLNSVAHNHPHDFWPNGSTERFILLWSHDIYILDKTSTLSHKSWRLLLDLQVDNNSIIPEEEDYDFRISQFGLMTCFYCSFSEDICLQDVQDLDKYNTLPPPHYWYL